MASTSSSAAQPVVRPVRGTFISTALTAIGIAVIAILVWRFLPATNSYPYAVAAVVVFVTWLSCPWLVRNLGKIVFPLGIIALIWFSLPSFGVHTPKIDLKLPSAESLKGLLPRISWEEEPTNSGPEVTSQSQSTEGTNSSAVATPPGQATTPYAANPPQNLSQDILVPTRRYTLRPEVDEKISADPVLLGVFQGGADFGSWMAYFIWIEKMNLQPEAGEWKGIRTGLGPSKASKAETDARLSEIYASKGIAINKDGYPEGKDDEATALIRTIFNAFQSIEQ